MKLKNHDLDFIVIGENIHTTRIVLRRGKRVTATDSGQEAVKYTTADGERRLLPIPEAVTRTQDYEEGRVKHVKIAVQAAMGDDEEAAPIGMDYLLRLVQRQEQAGADFLDLNVDEISLKPAEQCEAMAWLVKTVQDGVTTWDVKGGSEIFRQVAKQRLRKAHYRGGHPSHAVAGDPPIPEKGRSPG